MTWFPKSTQTVETSHWISNILDCVPLHSSSRLWDLGFQMRYKICSHQKRGLWTAEQQTSSFISLAKVRCFWHCLLQERLDKRNVTFEAHIQDLSMCGGSWCSKSSHSPLLVTLPHTFEWPFSDNHLQAVVIPAACVPFSSTLLLST